MDTWFCPNCCNSVQNYPELRTPGLKSGQLIGSNGVRSKGVTVCDLSKYIIMPVLSFILRLQLLTHEAVAKWDEPIMKGIREMTHILLELISIRLTYRPIPVYLLDLLAMVRKKLSILAYSNCQ